MKHLYIPFIMRSKHLEQLNALEKQVGYLKDKLQQAEQELEKFRAAQSGECVPSELCKNCDHSVEQIERYYGRDYETTVCGLTLPHCQNFKQKATEQ